MPKKTLVWFRWICAVLLALSILFPATAVERWVSEDGRILSFLDWGPPRRGATRVTVYNWLWLDLPWLASLVLFSPLALLAVGVAGLPSPVVLGLRILETAVALWLFTLLLAWVNGLTMFQPEPAWGAWVAFGAMGGYGVASLALAGFAIHETVRGRLRRSAASPEYS